MSARHSFDAIGTRWCIDTPQALAPGTADAVARLIADYDRTWSRFRPDAAVAPLREGPRTISLPPESAELAEFYRALNGLSRGAVTPLIGATLEQLGYGPDGVRSSDVEPAPPPAWEDAVEWRGTTLTTRVPLVLDVGAAGKGQLVDLVSALLERHGVHDHVVDASGDFRHAGAGDQNRATTVAVEDPRTPGFAIGVVEVQREAMCSSAGNRRRWAGRHHILDGRTGRPTERVIGTWVIADRAMVADGLATALSFVPAVVLEREFDFEFARMHADGAVEATGRFVDGLRFLRSAS